MAFNFSTMLVVFLPTLFDTFFNAHLVARLGYFFLIIIAILVGAIAGGITWTINSPKRW